MNPLQSGSPLALRNVVAIGPTARTQAKVADPLRAAGVEVHLITAREMTIVPVALARLPALRSMEIDAVVSQGWSAVATAAHMLGRALHVPSVVRLGGHPWLSAGDISHAPNAVMRIERRWLRSVADFNLSRVDAILPVSHDLGEIVSAHLRTGRTAVVPVPLPVTDRPPSVDTPEYLEDALSEGRRIICSMTNFDYWLKVGAALEIAAGIETVLARHDCLWVIAGAGPNADYFFEQLAAKRSPSFWLRAGYVDAWPLLHASDVFLHASRLEGMPGVVFEAQAAGCPVVANDTTGVPECATHEKTGLLGSSVDDLPALLDRILSDAALATRVAGAAREQVLARHSEAVVRRQMVDAIAAIAQGRR